MISRVDGAPTLPIKDEVDLAIDARAAEILREYDVTPEEAAQMARADVMQKMDTTGYPTQEAAGRGAAETLADLHNAAGASPERAMRLARNQVQTYGPSGAAGLAEEYATPEGMARLRQAQQDIAADDARHQRMYDDYFTATNAPSHQRVTPETQRQWDDTERHARERGRIIRAGLHPQTPVDPGTPEQNARWDRFLKNNPDEMARHRPEEAAASQKAADDQAWADRRPLLVKRYGEEEVKKMEAARVKGTVYVPNTKEQRERNQVTQDLETTAMQGSTPSRAVLQQRDKRRYAYVARPRQLRELGITPEEAKGMSDERIRIMLREKREEEKQAKDLLWRPRTMIQAGNAIGAMALPGMGNWQLSAIRGGPTPLDVDARHATMAADMARQAVTGFLANTPQGMTPAQQQMADLKARQEEEGLPPDAAAARERDRNDGVLPGASRAGQRVLKQIDSEYIGTFATESEIEEAVAQAVARGIPEADARAYFDRRRDDWFGFAAPRGGASQRPAAGSDGAAFGPGGGL